MIRIGIGYDFHQFAEGRRLILGGIEIPAVKGLKGHSDADVVLHSICDALLGAAGKGDIGQHFPNFDESYRDISSKELLKKVIEILKNDKWSINNIDVMVIIEEPKLEPFKDRMKKTIAEILGIENARVNIKATTTERIGPIGRSEACASEAVALIEKKTLNKRM
jgi:2-C-methyl-D-erythritol 2,4-cyclodiphosphate synthase